jgi:MFS family permease
MNQPSGLRRGPLLAVLLVGMVMNNIDIAIVNVAGPSVRAGLGASGAELELVVAGYVLAFAMLLITGARLGDVHGYRRLFLVGLGIFTVASLGCGLAPGAVPLIVARVVQGAGAAMMVPQVMTGIQRTFPAGPSRLRALGLYAAALSGGAVAGQVLGGVLVWADLFGTSWRPIFLINVPIGIVLLVAGRRVLPPADRAATGPAGAARLDLAGVALLGVAVLAAVLPLVLGRELGWPWWGWVTLAASVPAGVAFVVGRRRVAARGGHPLIDLAILTRPVRWGLACYALATSTYFALLFVLAIYLQQGMGRGALFSGLALVSWVAAFGVGGPLLRRFPARVVRYLGVIGYLVLGGGYLGLRLTAGSGEAALVAALGVGGLGLGLGFSAQLANLTGVVPARFAADLSGLVTTVAQLSAVGGVAVFGTTYLALTGGHGGAGLAVPAFTTVTGIFAAAALLAAAGALIAARAAAAGTGASGHAVPGPAASDSAAAESAASGRAAAGSGGAGDDEVEMTGRDGVGVVHSR